LLPEPGAKRENKIDAAGSHCRLPQLRERGGNVRQRYIFLGVELQKIVRNRAQRENAVLWVGSGGSISLFHELAPSR